MNKLEGSITELKNIGDSRRRAYERVGVSTIGDLLHYYPRAYQNRGNVQPLEVVREKLKNDEYSGPVSTVLTVATEPVARLIRRGMSILKLRAFDETGVCEITYFNQNFLKDVFHTGATFRFWGKLPLSHNTLQMTSPIYEPYIEGRELQGLVPVYPLTQGLTQKIITASVKDALKIGLPHIEETMPTEVLKAASLPTSAYAVRNIHFPESEWALEAAKRRLIFDEVFIASIALGLKGGRRRVPAKAAMKCTDISRFLGALPYSLTGAQSRSVDEIIRDMTSGFSMNRMLTGDVGSGKTVVAAAAAYMSLINGYDCLFMVPTEILATQHYKDICPLFESLGFEVCLLTGSTTASAKREIISRLADKTNPVLVIGTHALLSDDVRSDTVGLVIIDEQHRFGALQRATLTEKSEGINTLVMSATPIPRTLSLVVSGSLDVSRIDELPAGRQPVDTFVVNEGYRERLNGFIRRQVSEGHQVYIVCPAIEEVKEKALSENAEEMADVMLFDLLDDEVKPPLKAASTYAEELSAALPDLKVALVHGKMKNAEREGIMRGFCRGEIDVLVSTTVIEVGVNVPNATLMVVENAERFGLSQLHQLRGRVGRGSAKSYFILVSDAKGDKARERLSTIKNHRNGYEIAEADLRQRGPGDLFSENGVLRQSGKSSLVLAAGCTDTELLGLASSLAGAILEGDPQLQRPEHEKLRGVALKFIKDSESTIN